MKSNMDAKQHHECVQRAIALGRACDPAALSELIRLVKMPSPEIRRLAASAIGKLSGFGADPVVAVAALAPVALGDVHPQVRQYALKALKSYGATVRPHLQDLRDMVANPETKDYVRVAAASTVETIEEAVRIQEGAAVHRCQRCGANVSSDEYARSKKAFERVFCDRCFDEVYLDRRNFDTKVELNKTICAQDGTLVQSAGERIIADYLRTQRIAYRYDERFRIVEGCTVRPDFYLPEFDVYIEYWGMDTADYKIGMLKKQKLYQQQGKKLISLHFSEKSRLREVLTAKLSCYVEMSGAGKAKQSQVRHADD
jgi:hypothetical protein